MVIFKAKFDHNKHSNAANCTIFQNLLGGHTPPNPLSMCAVDITVSGSM